MREVDMMRRWLAVLMIGVGFGAQGEIKAAPTGPEDHGGDAPREVWPAEVAPELRRIQRELGGSVVEGFGEMGRDAPRGVRAAKPRAAGGRSEHEQRAAIDALREAAEQLDMSANRLERFELYAQADGLREQAQRLRRDARRMSDGEPQESRVEPVLPTPQLEPVPAPAELEPTPLRE